MEPSDLHKIWSAPDHSKLSPKQISIRLPIGIAAKIAALNDLFPNKTKSEIINDLLASALDEMEKGLPSKKGDFITVDQGEEIYDEIGIKGRFWELTNKYVSEFEKQAGIQTIPPVIAPDTKQKGKKKK